MAYKYKIGFLGYGKMASAISLGLNNSKIYSFEEQIAVRRNYEILKEFSQENKIKIAENNESLIKEAQVIILAVKPHQAEELLLKVKNNFKEGQILISVLAGVSVETLKNLLPRGVKIVRAMPNTPVVVAKGLTAVFSKDEEALKEAKKIFSAVGSCYEFEENLFPVVSALSGSGPAFFFSFMEAMAEAAVLLGLDKETAVKLSIETALGSAVLAQKSQKPFSVLKDNVSSPGGMTVAGTFILEKKAFKGIIMEALEASFKKSFNLL